MGLDLLLLGVIGAATFCGYALPMAVAEWRWPHLLTWEPHPLRRRP